MGEYCGSVHLSEPHAWITDNALYVTEYLIDIDRKYLTFILRQANLNQYANRMGQPNISQASIANVEIPCPLLLEQQKFIHDVEVFEEQIVSAQNIINSCASRKQAIPDKYLK